MKVILAGALVLTVLAFAISAEAFAQGKGDPSKGANSKGGDSKGGYEETHQVPEPGTLALLALGAGAVVFFARRRRK